MEVIKKILDNEKRIIEGFFISVLSGWVVTSFVNKSYKQAANLNFVTENMFTYTIALLVLFSLAFGALYYFLPKWSQILMFLLVCVYMVMLVYKAEEVNFAGQYHNSMGIVNLSVIAGLLVVLAFAYVKDSIFSVIKKIKISNIVMYAIVAAIGIFTFGIVAFITVYRYKNYGNSTFDFGIFAQMYEYMKQHGTMQTTVERNRLLSHCAVHFSPIFYLGLPLYFIFSSAVTVQVIQAIMIALPLIPIVLIGKKFNLSNKIIIAVSLIYALYPATTAGSFYDIHENCFLTFMILMLIWAVESKKNILTILFALLTFMVKEDAAIYVIILGTYWIFSRKDKKRGILLVLAGGVYFAIAVAVVNSYGLGVLDNRFSNFYFNPEGGLFQIIQTILTNPSYTLSQTVANSVENGMDKIQYLTQMFVPIGVLVFCTSKKYSRYILLAPIIVLNIFTTYQYFHEIGYQYNFGVVALFMYLIIMNLSELKHKKAITNVSVCVILCLTMFAGIIFPKASDVLERNKDNKLVIEKMDEAVSLIPRDASVTASGYILPHLSKNLVMFDPRHVEVQVATEYIIIDNRGSDEYEFVREEIESGKYTEIYRADNIVSVYKRIN